MSGKAKRRDEAGASDAESEGHHPPTKIPKKDSDDESDDIVVCEVHFSTILGSIFFPFFTKKILFYRLFTMLFRWNVDF